MADTAQAAPAAQAMPYRLNPDRRYDAFEYNPTRWAVVTRDTNFVFGIRFDDEDQAWAWAEDRDVLAGIEDGNADFDVPFNLGLAAIRDLEPQLATTNDMQRAVTGFVHGASLVIAESIANPIDDDALFAAQADVLGKLGGMFCDVAAKMKDAARKPEAVPTVN